MKYFFLILFSYASLIAFSQTKAVVMGVVPEIALSYKINDKFKVNTKVESFNAVLSNADSESIKWGYAHRSTDFHIFLSYRINPFQSVAVGYLYGIEFDDLSSHRITQQYNLIQRTNKVLLNHRFRIDQTFYYDEPWRLRIRYRVSIKIPLLGRTIDVGEPYLLTSDEILYGWQAGSNGFQNRLVFWSGYYFRNKNKLQAGLEYRLSFAEIITANTLWLRVSWFINLG